MEEDGENGNLSGPESMSPVKADGVEHERDNTQQEGQHENSVEASLTAVMTTITSELQDTIGGLIPAVTEVGSSAAHISEELLSTRASALARKQRLEEQREKFQIAARQVLDVLMANGGLPDTF
eukprot:TRINITY_DN3319_c0_g1_i1.p1 TRINITY_DN3319_c0_g1~~TRINITY_DN3319_c0_g1_i1.p1  ORF type:complete len:124 (-),score=33.47 TRINITY_DN3319_c0_g1_i1:455-826(-)